jgi:dTDP-glucose 4,6-dehydratase
MQNILVTGAAGFIGTNFVRYTLATYPDSHVVGFDNLGPGSNLENLVGLDEHRFSFVRGDIADLDAVMRTYRAHSITAVVNFAAESHNDRAIHDPSPFARSNAFGAQQILEASRQFGIERHVHVSTIEVYGEQGENVPYFDERSPLQAKTPYSAAKAAGDMMVRSYMHTYSDRQVFITHCANNYGPYQFPEKLIPLSLILMLQGKKARLYGDGLQKRDWLHVTDHCRAIDLVLRRGMAGIRSDHLPIYDISARQEITNREILERLCSALGRRFEDAVEYVADRPNHDRRYLIEPKRIETELGFVPSISFDRGIEETVRWYVDNEAWWRKILSAHGEKLVFDWTKPQGSRKVNPG